MKLLEVKNLTFGYEDDPVLVNMNLEVNENEIVLLEGENGAGKTTLLKCITNLMNNGHSIYIKDQEVYQNKEVLKELSFIMSEDTLYDYLTMNENIKFFKNLFQEDDVFMNHVYEICKELSIDQYQDYLIKNLSQGTRNKLYLALMLSKKHSILILDEPFTALDKHTQEIMLNKINEEAKLNNHAILMVTHINEFKQIATRKIELKKVGN